MKQRGMTLIEMMVLFVIGTVIVLIGLGFTTGTQSELTYGINGPMETRCAGGVKVLVGQTGHPIQLLDDQGHGIPCGDKQSLKLEK